MSTLFDKVDLEYLYIYIYRYQKKSTSSILDTRNLYIYLFDKIRILFEV